VPTTNTSCDGGDVVHTLEAIEPDLARLNLEEMREVARIDSVTVCWIPTLDQ
jgi:hypothetical protein